jgi:hypothetical protein
MRLADDMAVAVGAVVGDSMTPRVATGLPLSGAPTPVSALMPPPPPLGESATTPGTPLIPPQAAEEDAGGAGIPNGPLAGVMAAVASSKGAAAGARSPVHPERGAELGGSKDRAASMTSPFAAASPSEAPAAAAVGPPPHADAGFAAADEARGGGGGMAALSLLGKVGSMCGLRCKSHAADGRNGKEPIVRGVSFGEPPIRPSLLLSKGRSAAGGRACLRVALRSLHH